MSDLTILGEAWQFGINDPSAIAWLIVVAYLTAAVLCWRASGGVVQASTTSRSCAFWKMLAVCLVALGLNKQLDLHQLILEGTREFSMSGRVVIGFTAVSICALVARYTARLKGRVSLTLRCAIALIVLLLGTQVVRFLPGRAGEVLVYHIFTEEEGLLHVHLIELIELLCIIGVGVLALKSKHSDHLIQHDQLATSSTDSQTQR